MLNGGVKQRNGMLAFALEPNIMVNSTNMSFSLKSYIVDVDDQAVA
jgi:hypothetical protein